MAQRVRVCNERTGAVLAEEAAVARNPWQRAKGLLGRRALPAGEGLVIRPCNSIHCFFMAFPIDVLYVDKDGRVLRMVAALRPNRIGPIVPGAREVIELPAHTLATTGTTVGDRLRYEEIA